MKIRLLLVLVVLIIAAPLAGCSTGDEHGQMSAMALETSKESPVEASPELAVSKIYEDIQESNTSCSSERLSESGFTELTDITEDDAIEIVAYKSDVKKGLSDIFVVKPYPSLRENVRSKLATYREARMREFENFDILDSYSIAKSAVIYDQGEYLVMLMVSDVEAAQNLIDEYIPQ